MAWDAAVQGKDVASLLEQLSASHASLLARPKDADKGHWRELAAHFSLHMCRRGSVYKHVSRDDMFFVVDGEVDLVVCPAGEADSPRSRAKKKTGKASMAAFFRKPSFLSGPEADDLKRLKKIAVGEVSGLMELVKGVEQRRDSTVKQRDLYPTDIIVASTWARLGGVAILALSRGEYVRMRADAASAAKRNFVAAMERACQTSTVGWIAKASFLTNLRPSELKVIAQIANFRSLHAGKRVIAQGARPRPTRRR
jgi:hypothetical protein